MSATNRGAYRKPRDAYYTPAAALDPILDLIDWRNVDSAYEPCYGKGAILHPIARRIPLGASLAGAEITDGTDYLKIAVPSVDLLITNPPFSLALEFLTRSLTHSACVLYLLRLNFLGSQKRKRFWQQYRPTHLFVLADRPSFTRDGKSDATEYAWFGWDRGIIKLIKPAPGIYVV